LLCSARTWTEPLGFLDAQVVLTRRTGAEACRRVGELARPVSQVADEFGVCWETVMNAVVEHGTPLVDDPDRVGRVRQLGVDETSFLRANRHHHTIYATGLVDLEGRRLIDMVEGNAAVDLRRWTANADPVWLAGIEVVATDLAQSFRAGLSPHLDHAVRVADPFHVVRVANRCLDAVRRRVQNETLGHRGRKDDPLYKIRKLLLTGSERLNERGRDRVLLSLRTGDPNDEVVGAWLAKESVRDVYLAGNYDDAAIVLDKAIAGCRADEVAEIRSLGATLASWRTEILARHSTGASNGPTEGLNLCVKKVKRCGHGFRRFDNYRLRVLLHTGGVTWPERPSPPRIRTRCSPLR
jgi:transposase